jgi:hypothetical protein
MRGTEYLMGLANSRIMILRSLLQDATFLELERRESELSDLNNKREKKRLQKRQVPIQLPPGDLYPVIVPFLLLVRDEGVEGVVSQGPANQLAPLVSWTASFRLPGRDPIPAAFLSSSVMWKMFCCFYQPF